MTGIFLPLGGGCSRGKQQMFLTPGPLAIPLPPSSASLLSTLPIPHLYHLLSLSLLALFLNPFFLFPLYLLSSLLSLPLSQSSFFLPMAFSFQSFSCPLFSLSPLSPPHRLPTAPGLLSPLPRCLEWRRERHGKPSMEKPQPSDNGALSSDPAHPTPSLWGLFCVKFAVK